MLKGAGSTPGRAIAARGARSSERHFHAQRSERGYQGDLLAELRSSPTGAGFPDNPITGPKYQKHRCHFPYSRQTTYRQIGWMIFRCHVTRISAHKIYIARNTLRKWISPVFRLMEQITRFSEKVHVVGYALGCEAGCRLAKRIGMCASSDTVPRRTQWPTPRPIVENALQPSTFVQLPPQQHRRHRG